MHCTCSYSIVLYILAIFIDCNSSFIRYTLHIHVNLLDPPGCDPKTTMKDVFDKFGLDKNTTDFTGHALALYRDDE